MADEIVYLGGVNNPNTITVYDADGAAYDFSTVTRMVLTFDDDDETEIDISSGESPLLIDWTGGSGQIAFHLNDVAITPGRYRASLVEYDPAHLDGQVIFHIDTDDLRFHFIQAP